jgi:hypothetical protein
VNVTFVPAQIVVAEAEIETAGVTGVVTLIVIELLVAVDPFTHGALLVTTQLITSPFLPEIRSATIDKQVTIRRSLL